MSPNELHSYRLTSMDEPSDEMLDAIMDGVAKEALKSSQAASRELERRFEEMAKSIKLQRAANEQK